MTKDLYAKWYMIIFARLFGTKVISYDYGDHVEVKTTNYVFRNVEYCVDCKITKRREQQRLTKD